VRREGTKPRRLAERIARFNAGREPERLRLKYAAMRSDVFAFLRGTCHLFYERLPESSLLERAPVTWICGDLHLQNFGTYKGDNRLVYFDVNDFDEALLAPCTLDLVRLATSVLVAAETLRIDRTQARRFALRLLQSYAATIETGKARWIERESATGLIGALLSGLRRRKRKAFLSSRTRLVRGRRKLCVDGERMLAASAPQRRSVTRCIRSFAKTQGNTKFFRLLDVARRVAGTGSLGVERYVVLVDGKGSPDGNYLLDLKQALPSALLAQVKCRQPKWKSEAQRIVTLQRRIQAVSMAFLAPVKMSGRPFVLRALQPREDRIVLTGAEQPPQIEELMEDLGRLVAWGQLRSSGREGSATADQLIEYWSKRSRVRRLLDLARQCHQRVRRDWRAYCDAYDGGLLDDVAAKPARASRAKAVAKRKPARRR
jgi:uncharacterized protein (DUF2252 family)